MYFSIIKKKRRKKILNSIYFKAIQTAVFSQKNMYTMFTQIALLGKKTNKTVFLLSVYYVSYSHCEICGSYLQ